MNTTKFQPMQLPMLGYERAFRVMHSVLEGVGSKSERSCVFFACVGSYLLNKVYKINATPVAGCGLYLLGTDTKNIAVIGGMDSGKPFSDLKNFHMWVQTETHAIDFQAPLFKEAVTEKFPGEAAIPRFMFQRGLEEQCDGNFRKMGDFDLFPDPDLTKQLVNTFLARQDAIDLLQCCETWFAKPPKPIQSRIGLASNDGLRRVLDLSPIRIQGAWGR